MFSCSVEVHDGSVLQVGWKRKNSALPSKSSYSIQLLSSEVTSSKLVIPNVTNEDVGSYYCSVWNSRKGSQSRSAILSFSGLVI